MEIPYAGEDDSTDVYDGLYITPQLYQVTLQVVVLHYTEWDKAKEVTLWPLEEFVTQVTAEVEAEKPLFMANGDDKIEFTDDDYDWIK